MKIKPRNIFILCLFLYLPDLVPVNAVTDAELEALEKQIEQQEAERKREVEEEAKRKAEAEARQLAEEQRRKAEKEKRSAEIEQQKEEEKRKAEEASLAELKRLRQEQETKERAEKEKQKKYISLIHEAEEAVKHRDKKLAINKYNEALTLYPGNPEVYSGIHEAEKLMDKICYEFVGNWVMEMFIGEGWLTIEEDGTLFHGTMQDRKWGWKCIPGKRQILEDVAEIIYTLSDDGTCLLTNMGGVDSCYRRRNPDSK